MYGKREEGESMKGRRGECGKEMSFYEGEGENVGEREGESMEGEGE